ncbi:unnamed protein product [Phytophthora fragariaefolia]|uniref:Unnamed protein product n=1 Tax=Phytophthora fragariaefolia TaxID=1490495 RepID=A0A9W6YL11_9STRA|nr:unnamed protein product [Phytophthora fragariaefolia]
MSYQQLYEVLTSNSNISSRGCEKKTVYPVADCMEMGKLPLPHAIKAAKSITPANQTSGSPLGAHSVRTTRLTLQQPHSKHAHAAAQLDCEVYNRNIFNPQSPKTAGTRSC